MELDLFDAWTAHHNFAVSPRTRLPRTRVNKGMRKDRSGTQMVSGIERRQGLGVGMAPGYVGA
jgi:hypothetical protein